MTPRAMVARTMSAIRRARATGTWHLGRGATMRLGRRGVAWVHVQSGLVLVTREGDPIDHVLEPGVELLLTRDGLAVAWALEPSTLRVHALARGGDASPRGEAGEGFTRPVRRGRDGER